ncbi:hypothetical protein PhCBS80983_g03003 [Powellomyces hirtus]|uniref:Uncharacterized protein n=1 Tax=Powellomyces hirtus TaxID=109895 RepID=A0A507E464_9FUNG|nr:hypothetical protein PhCBS80983_g03003 [Powellomyces hirtus]
MAQGKFKKATTASSSSSAIMKKQAKKQGAGGPKAREGKYIAPKVRSLVNQKTLQKKLSARSIVQTERLMAARAGATGKLTIMKTLGEKAKAEMEKERNAKK